MTEKELRQKVVATAHGWIGRRESNGSHREILEIYNGIRPLPRGYAMKDTDPWCAAFVSAVAQKCGLTSIIFPECSCPHMIELYKAAGRWQERNGTVRVQVGDVVFYDWNADRKSDHVGIVEEVTASGYRVTEGNKNDAVEQRSVLVNYVQILGFGLPDYAAAADEEDAGEDEIVVEDPKDEADVFVLEHHVLRYGDGMDEGRIELREEVRAVQRALKALGFGLGRWGTDGEFGYYTKQAVIAYQRSVGLPMSGEADAKTTAALCGMR